VGGPAAPEAIGFEAVMSGTRQRVDDDNQLLEQMGPVLDALHTHFAVSAEKDIGRRS
jgi:hypothetical protein